MREDVEFNQRLAALAAADGRVAEANVAAAAVFAAAREAVTARLEHVAAGLVPAGAGDAAAVGRQVTLADAAGEAALANLNAVEGAAAGAGPFAKHFAKVLQRRAGYVVRARALDLESPFTLLERQLAPGQYGPVGPCRCASRRGAGLKAKAGPAGSGGTPFQKNTCHQQTPFAIRRRRAARRGLEFRPHTGTRGPAASGSRNRFPAKPLAAPVSIRSMRKKASHPVGQLRTGKV